MFLKSKGLVRWFEVIDSLGTTRRYRIVQYLIQRGGDQARGERQYQVWKQVSRRGHRMMMAWFMADKKMKFIARTYQKEYLFHNS